MSDYIFGANILENLTTGMYQDSKVIYREYIQNACDQIDKAVKEGLLKQGEGAIKIWFDRDQRKIVIEDNATGIPADSFQQILGNIADSDKKIGEDKGFRGIGRLCGLAYCKELVFKSSVKGEKAVSMMVCDAEKMRSLLDEHTRGKKYTANEVLHKINRFDRKETNDIDSHFFCVELIGINPENTDLLDFGQVKDYLSFVAPAPYKNTFLYRTEVHKHAQKLGVEIDEYNITLDGETIFKEYTTILKDSSTGAKYDDIFDVHCHDFYANEELFAWMWVGVTSFKKAIPKINKMRGLRLRKENIQIGGEDALQKLFKEDRGNSYFIGEVFAVDKALIPNAQRDYFNENPARANFERELRRYFNEELYKIYRDGSAINSALKKIDQFEKKEAEFRVKETSGDFVDETHRDGELKVVLESKKEAENARGRIDKMKDKADGLMEKIIQRIEVERPKTPANEIVLPPVVSPENDDDKPGKHRAARRTDRLSQYNKAERKLIAKILSIITKVTDSKTADMIIGRIEEELQ